jgi:hypothetical protein
VNAVCRWPGGFFNATGLADLSRRSQTRRAEIKMKADEGGRRRENWRASLRLVTVPGKSGGEHARSPDASRGSRTPGRREAFGVRVTLAPLFGRGEQFNAKASSAASCQYQEPTPFRSLSDPFPSRKKIAARSIFAVIAKCGILGNGVMRIHGFGLIPATTVVHR